MNCIHKGNQSGLYVYLNVLIFYIMTHLWGKWCCT